ncbi:hypothetical protein [Kribbella speibonae]|uniref:DUF1579 domain-containing protein n=1 Tax=Kribbella speibonae TaxID=1572660 RepID=A0A4R0J6Q7_9ACTN|nr:hypothetical protein [Kribbella speibonae]TCC40934.1 hypothetical protein E0H92_04425 [Kribbella speibonae]
MKKTLTARVLAGAAIIGAAGLFLGMAPSDAAVPARTAAVSAHAKPALKPASLHFSYKCWGTGSHCNVAVHAPTGWKFTQLSRQHAKFTDSSNTWMLRVNGGLGGKVSTSRAADQRVHALHGVAGFKMTYRGNGTTASKVGWDAPRVAYTQISYTYRDGARGQRWVSTRFVDTFENGRRAYIEITVSGRPQDQAGLNKVLTEATQRVALVG